MFIKKLVTPILLGIIVFLLGYIIKPINLGINQFSFSSNPVDNRITIGTKGNYYTIKEAVDWFNTSATANTEILLGSGDFAVADTITVSSTYQLTIRGVGLDATRLVASTGLLGKPFFNLKTDASLSKLSGTGSTLATYGNTSTENFINLNGTGGKTHLFDGIAVDKVWTVVNDTAGDETIFVDFVFTTTTKGLAVNHPNGGTVDFERGNFANVGTGIDLIAASSSDFIFRDLIFYNGPTSTAIKYDGTQYGYDGFAEIVSCSYNATGTFLSGFDFTRSDGRDANIVVRNNIGEEDKNPHAKINVIGSTSTTVVTAAGTFYKAALITSTTYNVKVTLDGNRMTYQPFNPNDGWMWISGTLSNNATGKDITIGVKKNNTGSIMGRTTVSAKTAGDFYSFATVVYVDDISKNDYYELFLTSSNAGDSVTIRDLTWGFDTR